MVDNKTIGISSLVTIGLITLSLLVPGFFEDTKYYCEAESSVKECPGGLSGGSGTRCYLNEEKNSWDYCKSGWAQVLDDRSIQEEPEPEPVIEPVVDPVVDPVVEPVVPEPQTMTLTFGQGKVHVCDKSGCRDK